MKDRLELFFEEQMKLNIKCNDEFEKTISTKDPDLIRKWIVNYSVAIYSELAELIGNKHKWWGKKDDLTEDHLFNLKIECIDVFHFVGARAMILGMDANEFWSLYMKKNKLNHKRQDEGYKDGTYKKIDENGKEDNHYLFEEKK